MWLKITIAQKFWFCKSDATHFPTSGNVKISVFPFTLSQQKCYIFKRILWIFKNLPLPERWGRCLLWLKITIAQKFWFCKSDATHFPTSGNVKISVFAFTLSQQKCYIFKRILWIFKNFPLPERWCRWLLWLKISIAQKFWFCKSNATHFPTSRKCKNFYFSLYTVPAEILYLQKYFTNFQKRFSRWKMMKVAIVVENFRCTEVLVLQ